MRDLVSCFSENSVNVSQSSSCSNYSNKACISPSLSSPSVQNAVTCLYRIILSNQKQHFITVTWSKNPITGQALSINFGDDDDDGDYNTSSSSAPPPFKVNTNSRFLFRKKKGNRVIERSTTSASSKIEVFWDLTNARYDSGPEPVEGFYVIVVVDFEIGLVLGKLLLAEDIVAKKLKNGSRPLAKVSIISRREHCSGNAVYATRAQFCETGAAHDILIRCCGGGGGGGGEKNEGMMNHPVLSVCIDKKTVIRVKRLQWNFRGNHSIFVDGLLVDLMWDVHDWFFNNPASSSSSSSSSSGSYAVFMFRTRRGFDSRLWLEEKNKKKLMQKEEQETVEFSLLIYACKNSLRN